MMMMTTTLPLELVSLLERFSWSTLQQAENCEVCDDLQHQEKHCPCWSKSDQTLTSPRPATRRLRLIIMRDPVLSPVQRVLNIPKNLKLTEIVATRSSKQQQEPISLFPDLLFFMPLYQESTETSPPPPQHTHTHTHTHTYTHTNT